MTPQHVISQLLESDTKYPQNLDLLKKIIITAYLGRLRINGLPPDNKISLGNYLFDDERMIFDFTRLSDEKRALFTKWLLDPHQQDKEQGFLSGVYVNEYRGFTAEVELSWWGILKNWLFNNKSEHWKITDLGISLNYQLTGIDMFQGKQGILIGFNQFLIPPAGTKYRDPDDLQREPLGNAKRVFITDKLVDELVGLNYKSLNFESVCKSPHPQSIDVINPEARHKEMYIYRKMQRFVGLKPWYVRLWKWISQMFTDHTDDVKNGKPSEDNKLVLLYQTETVNIYQRSKSKEILVTEKRPDITNLVFCGGGAKIFAHIGVWKALNEAGIKPTKFAGSSAGAIMALMCYLGYSAEEIRELFKHFKQEHLVQFDIDRNGLSDAHSLKTALDYAINKKVSQIVAQYNIPYPKGKITFSTLDSLRQQFPDCGLGEELIVTATNKRLGKTSYLDLKHCPLMELSEAVKISASFPVLYRHTLLDGEEHNDGGILSNFPTEVFFDDHSTLLESEFGNNLKVLAVQFDNGVERNIIDRIRDKVYRENFILNWIYSLLTGVSDPASGWERDRLKLRQYAMQTIIPNTGKVSTTGFSVDEKCQVELIQNGYDSTMDYIKVRYARRRNAYVNKELMYSTFNSLGDLLAYCCYRGNSQWFDIVNNLIVQSTLPNRTALMKQSLELRKLYYFAMPELPSTSQKEKTVPNETSNLTFFGNAVCHHHHNHDASSEEGNHKVLLALYPIFLKLSSELVSKEDKNRLTRARHALSIHAPFDCLKHFNKIAKDAHIIIYIITKLIKELEKNPRQEIYDTLEEVRKLLYSDINLLKANYFGTWDLSVPQCKRVLNLFKQENHTNACTLVAYLRDNMEPMKTVKEGVYHDDLSDEGSEGHRVRFS
ncbi:phospholipase [Legionella norrlandica]|uniref:Phospholipase n=1 Tax=Legionella norrlandica TaxID=1498499 RepID=A0A0A2SXK4_9GAMM|nr:Dot/Icm T4SS effector VpdC [Legionella norrlandica]KGP64446.1 phospholipase [Legionella norrlandica]